MTQEEIWINHIKNTKVNDVIKEYNNPAIFQNELVALINKESSSKSNIIELGCELGVTSMLLSDNFTKTLLDLNPLAIDLTKQAHKKLNKKADFIVGDMFNIPFDEKSFDVIFNAGVIEHFNKKDRTKAFIEYSRVLKDNGVMYIAFPNHYSFPYRIAYLIRKILNKWPYPDEFKMYNLQEEIKDSNLILEERIILSKGSVMRWLDFLPPLKWLFQTIDIFYKFEGYLTVLKIRKKI
jgi:ubiquinone/menaquinone biosynthesis C-methylase UbiE